MSDQDNNMEERIKNLEIKCCYVDDLINEVNILKSKVHLLEMLLSANEENRRLRENTPVNIKKENKSSCSRFRAF